MTFAKMMAGMTLAAAVVVPAVAQEPTRGFLIERAGVAAQGDASVDLATSGEYSSGGVRLGLGKSELILNSGKAGEGSTNSEMLFKLGLSPMKGLSEVKHALAVYGGVAVYDEDTVDGESYNNIILGAAFTAEASGLLLNIAPEFIFDDATDDNYLDIGLSAHMKMAKGKYGTFQPGIEAVATTADAKDTVVGVGMRWEYNDRLTLDIVPLQFGDIDTIGLPGLMRINARF